MASREPPLWTRQMGVWTTSIRSRLMIVIMVSSVTGLLLASTAFVLYDRFYVMERSVEELSLLAGVTAERSRGALVFRDHTLAEKGVASLRARPNIEVACLYDEEAKLFSSYFRGGTAGRACPPASSGEPVRIGTGSVEILEPVELNGRKIGELYLRSNLNEINERVKHYATVIITIALVVALFTFLLSFLLQRGISGPLARLSGVAGVIADKRDYSVRAAEEEISELQVLVKAFNRMLVTIEEQNRGLYKTQDELETLVRERTRELEQKTKRLEESDRLKNEFLASVTHELKTPLNSIIGFSGQVMKKAGHMLPQRQRENMERVRRNADNLLGLINELLEFSRLGTGRTEVCVERFSLPPILDELLLEFGPLAREKGLDLEGSGFDEGIIVLSDREKVKSILSKLLNNAIKFTPAGGSVAVSGGRFKQQTALLPEAAEWFFFSVKDTGIGISREDQMGIFEEFRQVDGSLARRTGGTGVGLAITKRLVSLLSGKLTVDSEKGRGAAFKLLLPSGHLSASCKPREARV